MFSNFPDLSQQYEPQYPTDISQFRSNNQMQRLFPQMNYTPTEAFNPGQQQPMMPDSTSSADPNAQNPSNADELSPIHNMVQALGGYDTTLGDLYKKAIGNPPQRPQPSIGRRILGGLASLQTAGPSTYGHGAALGFNTGDPRMAEQARDSVLYGDYNRQNADYQERLKELGSGAAQERLANTSARLGAYQAATQMNRDKRTQVYEEDIKRKTLEGQQRNDRMNRFADIKQLLVTRPDYRAEVDKNGDLYLINKHDANDIVKTDLSKLSDTERIELNATKRQQDIAARGQSAKDLEAAREENRQKDITTRGSAAIDAAAAKKAGGGGLTPSQQNVQQYMNARQYLNSHPDADKYITVDNQTKSFKLMLPSDLFGLRPVDKKKFDDIYNAIYGSEKLPQKLDTTPSAPAKAPPKPGSTLPSRRPSPSTTNVAPKPSAMVRMRHPDGRTGSFPADRVKDAIAAGYVLIPEGK